MRVGLVGCGAVARAHHLPALRRMKGATLVGVADPDPAAGADFADPAELIERVDAVVIATPPAHHAELAIAAARAGKHVYVEKPLATTEADAASVIEEVERAGVRAAVGFNRRLHPAFVQARGLLPRIGDVRFVQTAFCEPTATMPEWKRARATGGGVLLDLGSHHFDLVRWLLGAELEVVSATTSSAASEQDEATVELAATTGARVQSVFSFRAGHADFVELHGEQGRLRVDRHRASVVLHVPRRGYGIRRAWTRPVLVRGDPSYRRTLEAFVRGDETPALDDGLASLRLVLAAERSAS